MMRCRKITTSVNNGSQDRLFCRRVGIGEYGIHFLGISRVSVFLKSYAGLERKGLVLYKFAASRICHWSSHRGLKGVGTSYISCGI